METNTLPKRRLTERVCVRVCASAWEVSWSAPPFHMRAEECNNVLFAQGDSIARRHISIIFNNIYFVHSNPSLLSSLSLGNSFVYSGLNRKKTNNFSLFTFWLCRLAKGQSEAAAWNVWHRAEARRVKHCSRSQTQKLSSCACVCRDSISMSLALPYVSTPPLTDVGEHSRARSCVCALFQELRCLRPVCVRPVPAGVSTYFVYF